jgi:hypothetical protein
MRAVSGRRLGDCFEVPESFLGLRILPGDSHPAPTMRVATPRSMFLPASAMAGFVTVEDRGTLEFKLRLEPAA